VKNVSKYIDPDYIEKNIGQEDCSCDDSTSEDEYIHEMKGWDDDEYVKEMYEYRISNNDCDKECIEEMREYIESERLEGKLDNNYNVIINFFNDPTNKRLLEEMKENEHEEYDEKEYKVINNKVDGPLDERTRKVGGTSYRR
jgi:hypothetical protein